VNGGNPVFGVVGFMATASFGAFLTLARLWLVDIWSFQVLIFAFQIVVRVTPLHAATKTGD
jgi:hypothetical protein